MSNTRNIYWSRNGQVNYVIHLYSHTTVMEFMFCSVEYFVDNSSCFRSLSVRHCIVCPVLYGYIVYSYIKWFLGQYQLFPEEEDVNNWSLREEGRGVEINLLFFIVLFDKGVKQNRIYNTVNRLNSLGFILFTVIHYSVHDANLASLGNASYSFPHDRFLTTTW